MAAVDLHSDLAHAELAGHLLVHQTGGDERHDFALARRESLELGLEHGHALLLLPPLAIAFERIGDGVKQVLIAEWLGEEIYGTCLHRPHRHRHIAMGSNEDDGDLDAGLDQLVLKIEATTLRQSDVEHETA